METRVRQRSIESGKLAIVAAHLDGGDRGANPNQSLLSPPESLESPDSVIALKSFEKIPPGDKTSRGEERGLPSESKRSTAKAKEPTAFDSRMSPGNTHSFK